METDQIYMNKLPNEILLQIFRNVSAKDFIVVLPFVCRRWQSIIQSDSQTIKQIGMIHCNNYPRLVVEYFYTKTAFDNFLHLSPANIETGSKTIQTYLDACYSCIHYSGTIYKHITVLEIKYNLETYFTMGFTYLKNLTTLIFSNINFKSHTQKTVYELTQVYSNIQNVAYIECNFSTFIDMTFLHHSFRHLKQFRLDHNIASDRFLENLLDLNHYLETIIFRNCIVTGDRWFDVLLDKLKGRSITSLSIHSPYFTSEGVNKFLNTDILKLDKLKVNISFDRTISIPFCIKFV